MNILLAQSGIFGALGEILGVPSAAIEGGAITLLIIAMIGLIQVLRGETQQGAVQQNISQQLIQIAASVIQQNSDTLLAVKDAIEKMILNSAANTSAIRQELEAHNKLMQGEMSPLSMAVKDIKSNLFKASETRVLIKSKQTGEVYAEFTAIPDKSPDGELFLVVEYDVKVNKKGNANEEV